MTIYSFVWCWLYNWQTLITGGVALLVGGATVAAIRRQIAEARRSGDEQVAAMLAQVEAIEKQIEDQKMARDETDRSRRVIAEQAVRAEAELSTERARVDDLWKKKPYEPRVPGELNIDSSPLWWSRRHGIIA